MMAPTSTSTTKDLAKQIKDLGPWFHNIDLGGITTAPTHFLGDYPRQKWKHFAHTIPSDLRGKTVLDIGCNGGFYSLEMKRRGAEQVIAIDNDELYVAQARFVSKATGLDIDVRKMDVYEIGDLRRTFDIVLFMGVLYHLRHPLLALDLIHDHVVGDKGVLIFQSMQRGDPFIEPLSADYPFEETAIFNQPGYPRLHFVERSYSNDPTNWWIPNRACAEAMLRSAGFRIDAHPEEEVYLCRRNVHEGAEKGEGG